LIEDDPMADNATKNATADQGKLRDKWLLGLSTLMDTVQGWAQELGWSTRRIEKRMEDSQIGTYQAPALLMQEGTTRMLLEPIARSAPGVDGVVDLYLMPAYDDIATLYHCEGQWQLHYLFPGTPAAPTISEANSKPLSKETFKEVLEEMLKNAT
jgi:hypothetical protein